jgi:hypothetical protein
LLAQVYFSPFNWTDYFIGLTWHAHENYNVVHLLIILE